MMLFLYTLLAIIPVLQAILLSNRDPLNFGILLFILIYSAFFVLAPILDSQGVGQREEQVIYLSMLFLVGLNIPMATIFLLSRKRVYAPIALEWREAIIVSRAGKILAWIAFFVTGINFATAGVPWLSENPEMARHELSGSGFIQIFLTRAMPAAVLAIIWAERWRKGRIVTRTVVFYLSIWLAMTFLQGFRVHLVFAILYLFALSFVIRQKFIFSQMLASILLISVTFLAISWARSADSSSFDLWELIRHRIGFELIWTAGYSMQIVNTEGLWWGKSILMDLQSALPGPGISYGDYLLAFVAPTSDLIGLAALTPSVLGEAYVNFHLVGVLIYGMLIPLLFIASTWFARKRRMFGPVLAAMVPILMTQVVQVGFGQVLASRLIPFFLFYLFLEIIARSMYRRNSRATMAKVQS